MQGIFKGWIANKPFGFVTPDDGSTDVFLHESKVTSRSSLIVGARVDFEIETSEKGSSVVSVAKITAPERKRGRVSFWNERGFGFIAAEDGSADVHVSSGALPPSERGYLCEGYIVEYSRLNGAKGATAGDLEVVGWTPPLDPLSAFADMGGPGWLESLATLGKKNLGKIAIVLPQNHFPSCAATSDIPSRG